MSTLDQCDEIYRVENKKILFRADLNVPVLEGLITDTSRIKVIKSSIDKLISNKNKIFLIEDAAESLGSFYPEQGWVALNNMINTSPESLPNYIILDEQGGMYSLTEFVDIVEKLKIKRT